MVRSPGSLDRLPPIAYNGHRQKTKQVTTMTRIEKLLQQAQATVQASKAYEVKVQAAQSELDTLSKSVGRLVRSLELTPEEKALLEFPENK
jgi:hypothetical protein